MPEHFRFVQPGKLYVWVESKQPFVNTQRISIALELTQRMALNPVGLSRARSELNGALSCAKGFSIPLQSQEDGALLREVVCTGRGAENGSFKGIQGLFVVTYGSEDQSNAMMGFCMLGIKFQSVLKGGECLSLATQAMEGEALAGVAHGIDRMLMKTKFKQVSGLGESVKGLLAAPELQEHQALEIISLSKARVKKKHVRISLKGFFVPLHLLVLTPFSKPLLFGLAKEVRTISIPVDRVASVRHRIDPRQSIVIAPTALR